MKPRAIGIVLIAVGVAGLLGTAWVVAERSGTNPGIRTSSPLGGVGGSTTCHPPALPGQLIDVFLSDMGGTMGPGMMGGGGMMSVSASPSAVGAGQVSFRVWNTGMMVHELVILPLLQGEPGTRSIAADGQVSEAGSLGEASKPCGAGAGDGIAPGTAGWVTMHLAAGRYELICNLPGHYARGMFTELDSR